MLQHRGDLFVGQRVRAVLFLDHLLHLALEQQQRRIAPQGPLHGFGEEIPELINSDRICSSVSGCALFSSSIIFFTLRLSSSSGVLPPKGPCTASEKKYRSS